MFSKFLSEFISQHSANLFTAILLALALQRQLFLCLTEHLIDFDIKYLIPPSCMVLLFWEILFMHYFHLTLMSNTFTLFLHFYQD